MTADSVPRPGMTKQAPFIPPPLAGEGGREAAGWECSRLSDPTPIARSLSSGRASRGPVGAIDPPLSGEG